MQPMISRFAMDVRTHGHSADGRQWIGGTYARL